MSGGEVEMGRIRSREGLIGQGRFDFIFKHEHLLCAPGLGVGVTNVNKILVNSQKMRQLLLSRVNLRRFYGGDDTGVPLKQEQGFTM